METQLTALVLPFQSSLLAITFPLPASNSPWFLCSSISSLTPLSVVCLLALLSSPLLSVSVSVSRSAFLPSCLCRQRELSEWTFHYKHIWIELSHNYCHLSPAWWNDSSPPKLADVTLWEQTTGGFYLRCIFLLSDLCVLRMMGVNKNKSILYTPSSCSLAAVLVDSVFIFDANKEMFLFFCCQWGLHDSGIPGQQVRVWPSCWDENTEYDVLVGRSPTC